MIVDKTAKPEIVQLFENLLWVNSPKNWILKSAYFQEKLFVTMLVLVSSDAQYKKVRRSYSLKTINDRIKDIHGLAKDCTDEMKKAMS